MDGGWSDYKRSLSGFSSFDSGISTLKDKAKTDMTKVFEMDKLNLGDEALQVGQLKSTLDTVGESAGGLATTMLSLRSFGAMRKHLKNISDKIGGKESNEEVGEKNSTAEKAKPTEEEGDATGDAVDKTGTRNIQVEDEGNVAPRAEDIEVPEQSSVAPRGQSQEVELRDMSQRGEGADAEEGETFRGQPKESTESSVVESVEDTEPNFGTSEDPLFQIRSKGSSSAPFTEKPTDTLGTAGKEVSGEGDELAADIATEGADVAADASTGLLSQIFDAIPIVGEVVGAVVGIGAAVAGGIEAGKEASDEKLEEADSKAELSINSASAVANKFGNSVTPTLTSLSQMPSNAGIF